MTKSPSLIKRIEENRREITTLLSGIDTIKRLNNLNFLRHQISVSEPESLHRPSPRNPFNFTSIKNLGTAYDYIVNAADANYYIDSYEITKIHSMVCASTVIPGGTLRDAPVVLDIQVDGGRLHAPESYEIPSRLNKIVYDLYNGREHVLTKAFNLHYELVVLQPFHDCNKRTARYVMNAYLMSHGFRPIAFNYESDRDDYINAIEFRANGNKKAYYKYMQSCMLRTQLDTINNIKKSKAY